MSDGNNNSLDILIRFIRDKTGADLSKKDIAELKQLTTDAGKEGVKQQEAVEQATNKTFASKKQLKDMVKQLGHEFPILGQLGRLALNPIVLVTTGITAAFQIWKFRTDELTRSLGGIEMPDMKEDMVTRAERLAEAYSKMAVNAGNFSTKASDFQKSLDAVLKTIEYNDALAKAMGIDTGTNATDQKATATSQAATAIEIAARANLAKGGKEPNSVALAFVDKNMKEAAMAAQSKIDEAKARRKEAQDYQEMSFAEQMLHPVLAAKLRARYPGARGDRMGDAAAETEGRLIQEQQPYVDRYQNLLQTQGSRKGSRDLGNSLQSLADSMRDQELGFRRGSGVSAAADFKKAADDFGSPDMLRLPQAIIRLAQSFTEAADKIDKAQAAADRIISNNNQRP